MHGDNRNGTGDASDPEDSRSEGSGVTRRRMLAAGVATWASVSLAGCSYITDPGVEEETTSNGQDTTTTVTSNTTTTDDPGTDDGTTSGGTQTTSCEQRAEFLPGMEVGMLIDVFNSEDGSFVGAEEVESVSVSFPDADIESQELDWTGDHETQSEKSWGTAIETAPDAEPGTYRYEVTVEPKPEADIDEVTITDQFTIV